MSIRLRSRRLPLIAALALASSLIAMPSTVAAAPGSHVCTVINRTQATVHHNLQHAANAASSYDVLQVQGVCTGSTTISQNLFIQGKTTAAGPAVLDGGGVGRVLWIDAGYTVGIKNLKIRNGRAPSSGDPANDEGGAIYDLGHLRLTNVVVRGNRATAHGGGIWVEGGRLALKGNTTIRRNAGGGVAVHNGVMSMYDTSSVYGNTIEANDVGAGVSSEASRFVMNDSSTIFGNEDTQWGGGLYADVSGSVTMNDASSIHDNSAGPSGNGGGISYWCGYVTLVGVVAGGNVHGNSPDNVACTP